MRLIRYASTCLLFQVETFSSLPPIDLLVARNRSGLILLWSSVHTGVNELVYQLTIRQVPDHGEAVMVNLPAVSQYRCLSFDRACLFVSERDRVLPAVLDHRLEPIAERDAQLDRRRRRPPAAVDSDQRTNGRLSGRGGEYSLLGVAQ